jgi:hypothetical protein
VNAVVPVQASLPFSDTFQVGSPAGDPSDGSQLSRSWTDQTGNVTVVGGAAKGIAGSNLSTVNGINAADVTVQATVALNGGAFAGLVARYSGPLTRPYFTTPLVDAAQLLLQQGLQIGVTDFCHGTGARA